MTITQNITLFYSVVALFYLLFVIGRSAKKRFAPREESPPPNQFFVPVEIGGRLKLGHIDFTLDCEKCPRFSECPLAQDAFFQEQKEDPVLPRDPDLISGMTKDSAEELIYALEGEAVALPAKK